MSLGAEPVHALAVCQDSLISRSAEGESDEHLLSVEDLAADIGVDAQDLLRQMRQADESQQRQTLQKHYGSSARLVDLDFEVNDEGNVGDTTTSEMRHTTTGTSSDPRLVVRTPSSLSRNSREGGQRVKFGSNVAESVTVFDLGEARYVGVEFKRRWTGWMAVAVVVVASVVFAVHITWLLKLIHDQTGEMAVVPLFLWVSLCRLVLSIAFFLVCYLGGVGIAFPPLAWSLSCGGVVALAGAALALTTNLALDAATVQFLHTTHSFAAAALPPVWILITRVVRRNPVFLPELAGATLTIVGFLIGGWEPRMVLPAGLWVLGNVLALLASLAMAVYLLIVEFAKTKAPVAPIVLWLGVVSVPVSIALALGNGYTLRANTAHPVGVLSFLTDGYMLHTAAVALEGLLVDCAIVVTMLYLDVLSVAMAYTMRAALIPFCVHMVGASDSTTPLGPYLYAGSAVVVVATFIIVVFASVRRSFVARRLAYFNRRHVPHPYRRGARDDAAVPATIPEPSLANS